MDPERKKRVLFVGEAVTLSHVVRPAVLAKSLIQIATTSSWRAILGITLSSRLCHSLWSRFRPR
jgi:hypothetical protein